MTFYKALLIQLLISIVGNICSGQDVSNSKWIIQGTDSCIKNTCQDSCVITYPEYSVITKPRKEFVGENICITAIKTGIRSEVNVRAGLNAQYFQGLFNGHAIIDEGTGIIRTFYFYSLNKNVLTDSVMQVLGGASIKEGKLFFSVIMDPERVKSLKLPECKNSDLEFSGYTEDVYYDFENRKTISTGEYKCIK